MCTLNSSLIGGNNFFSIFFKDVEVLRTILQQLDIEDFSKQTDAENNEIENSTLRKIYF